jgi:nuclear inhibitor of protein phosphatase 1
LFCIRRSTTIFERFEKKGFAYALIYFSIFYYQTCFNIAEDIDPSVGRFRNLISTTVIPKKVGVDFFCNLMCIQSVSPPQKARTEYSSIGPSVTDSITKRIQGFPYSPGLYDEPETSSGHKVGSIAAKLGLKMPNLAPELEDNEPVLPAPPPVRNIVVREPTESSNPLEPKKKKYAKEAWPGKKPAHSLFG